MKHFVIFISLISIPQFTIGQTQSIESLKKENIFLKEQIKALRGDTSYLKSKLRHYKGLEAHDELEIKQISNIITTKIISCLGDRNNQTVTIEFVVGHDRLHQSLCIANDPANVKAFDGLGNELPVRITDIGTGAQRDLLGSGKCNKVPTEVPVKGSITFRNVLPGTDMLKFVSIAFKFRNYDSNDEYVYGTLEIKNLPVKW